MSEDQPNSNSYPDQIINNFNTLQPPEGGRHSHRKHNQKYLDKKTLSQTLTQDQYISIPTSSSIQPQHSSPFVAPNFLQTLPSGLTPSFEVSSLDFNGLISPLEVESNRDAFFYYNMLELTNDEISSLQALNSIVFGETNWVVDEKTQEVSAASFEQLVIYLTSPDANNLSFQKKFLTTFISFATPNYLLGALFTRYFPNFDIPDCNIQQSNIKPIRDRIIRILTVWFKTAPYMFQSPVNLLVPAIEDFCEYLQSKQETVLSEKVLKSTLDSVIGNSKVSAVLYTSKQKIPEMLPLPQIPPEQWHLEDINPIELARQVTQHHCSIFMKIGPMELLTAIWGAKKGGGAPNLDELTAHFDVFSRYCSQSVICGQTPKIRSHTFQYWIDVAAEFLQHQNFHGMFAVMAGLTHVSVTRLKANKCTSKQKKIYQQLLDLSDYSSNYKNYREYIETPVHPRILFLGAFQKDLIYVQEQFPNKIGNLINFKKCDHCMKLLETIAQCQNERFMFHTNQKIQDMIAHIPEPLQSTGLMKMSMAVEPKK